MFDFIIKLSIFIRACTLLTERMAHLSLAPNQQWIDEKVKMTEISANIEAKNSPQLFSDLCISKELKQGIEELGYKAPTNFQRGVFDTFCLGKNLVGEGNNYGKSLAFSLPILSKIDPNKPEVQALIVCESLLQSEICIKECKALGRHLNIEVGNAQSLLNGAPVQIAALALPDLSRVDLKILASLAIVFFDGLSKVCAEKALSLMPDLSKLQILIFGQDTLNAFKEHAANLIDDAVFISNQDQPRIAMPAKHIFHQPKEAEPKPRALLAALETHHPKNALITCNDGQEAELLAKYLARYGYKTAIAEDRNFSSQLRSMLSGSIDVLLCQSSSVDGQTLENVPFMINYDMFDRPQSYESTTQFNKQAPGLERTIVNILTNRELGFLGPIKAQCLIEFSEMPLPSDEEVLDLSAERILQGLKNEASFVELGQFEPLASKILASKGAVLALSLLLKNHFSKKPVEADNRERRYNNREPRQPRERDDRPRSHDDSRPAPERSETPSGTSRLYITLGRQDKFNDLASLAQHLSEKSGVDLGHFSGGGMIRDNSAHIEVDDDVAETIIAALNGSPRPNADEAAGEVSNVVCERARQAQRPSYRRPPQRRRPNFQRRDR